MKKLIFSGLLITLGVLFRTVWHLGPNIEFVTTSAILSAMYLGGEYAVLVPLLIMIITDKMLGNTDIYWFTWSAYILIGILSCRLNKIKNQKSKIKNTNQNAKIIWGTIMGVEAALFFYLWTNFGVWVLDSWGMYSRDINGLISCYIMGLPFLKLNLIGNLIFLPTLIYAIELVKFNFLFTFLRAQESEPKEGQP